jgi:uncharacterized protein YcbX
VAGSVAWISVAPVKGLRVEERDEVELTRSGLPGDRAFFVVDARRGAMVSIVRLGPLAEVVPAYDAARSALTLTFPDGREVTGNVELGDPEDVVFTGRRLSAQPLLGDFADELSAHCGRPLRMFAAPAAGAAYDRADDGTATLLSVASLERLAAQAGQSDAIDHRRFRMNFGVEGVGAHEEDDWIGRDVRIGDALVQVSGNVGRCAATTRDPETGVVDFKALHHLAAYRGDVETTEELPFGVHAMVAEPGRVRRGDPVEPV